MGAKRAVRPSGDTITDGSDHAVKVLVIDDQPLLRDVLAEFLELLGHEADLAADGREGLARFDPSVHQIVLTDFLMPGLTGLEVAAAIRARGAHASPPSSGAPASLGPSVPKRRRRISSAAL